MSTMQEESPCVWYAEADEIESSEKDFDTADCAELPDEFEHLADEAALDDMSIPLHHQSRPGFCTS